MRIQGLEDNQFPFILKPLAATMKRHFGKMLTPYRVWAHLPGITWFYSLFMNALESSKIVDASIKRLVCLRAAQLIGCPF
ncbi:MAG TPA: hypothetical protein VMA09_10635 [Candidatus Binataceae bacterium]|nr:hypothetical protein [Candidatus Binataceae bacterium]